tara:strand:- start:302 stop:1159 length:858 start_codon:yes stop_codon:yes gene_type:complete
MILVTGATGNLGSLVIENLLKKVDASEIAAFVRDAEKASDLKAKGVDLRVGTYDDTSSLDNAMQGVDKVLLVSGLDPNRYEQHKNVVDAAKKAGVQFIGYTGVSMKDIDSATNKFMGSHFQTEDYIKASGLNYAFFRNTLYTEGLPLFLGEGVFEQGIFLPAGEGKVPYALRTEMAEAIANVLAGDTNIKETYEITGAEAVSFGEIAQMLTDLSGKEVGYVSPSRAQFEEVLKGAGVPDWAIGLVADFSEDIRDNQHNVAFDHLEKLLGRKPADVKSVLKGIYNL